MTNIVKIVVYIPLFLFGCVIGYILRPLIAGGVAGYFCEETGQTQELMQEIENMSE